MDLAGVALWLSETQGSIALHESLYMYTLIESIHVIGITLFVGSIAMVDLRLLGRAFSSTPVSEMTRRILPWTVAGFVIMAATGLLLFYAIPVRTYHSVWFRLKVVLFLIAAANIWFFHRRVQRDVEYWDRKQVPPRSARLAATISLVVWASVVVAGRMIAYNWADCDRPQPDWINWIAQCASYGG
jgi:uncharacterized membrane protein